MFFKKLHPILTLPIFNRERGLTPKECLKRDFSHYVKVTDDATNTALQIIEEVMRERNCSYSEAIETEEGRGALFQLLLHRQWIAFHAESIRIVEAAEKKLNGLESISDYETLIEQATAPNEMDILLKQFAEETQSHFSKLIDSWSE